MVYYNRQHRKKGGKKMLKRYKMYYNEAVGKIEMIGEPDYDVGDFRIG